MDAPSLCELVTSAGHRSLAERERVAGVEETGEFEPSLDGHLVFELDNGDAYWNTKEVLVRVWREGEEEEANASAVPLFPSEPVASLAPSSGAAWDLARHGLVGIARTPASSAWERSADDDGFVVRVPRGRTARVAVPVVGAGSTVRWAVRVVGQGMDLRACRVSYRARGEAVGEAVRDALRGPDVASRAVQTPCLEPEPLLVAPSPPSVPIVAEVEARHRSEVEALKDQIARLRAACDLGYDRTLVAERARLALRGNCQSLRDDVAALRDENAEAMRAAAEQVARLEHAAAEQEERVAAAESETARKLERAAAETEHAAAEAAVATASRIRRLERVAAEAEEARREAIGRLARHESAATTTTTTTGGRNSSERMAAAGLSRGDDDQARRRRHRRKRRACSACW